MSFDEEHVDEHVECVREIHRLEVKVADLKAEYAKLKKAHDRALKESLVCV